MYDCPGKEDEEECSTCPGMYRCLSSQLCLLDIHLCDGVGHCPQKDDELLCNRTCPDNCTCHGLAFTCIDRWPSDVSNYPDLRYLDISGETGGDGVVERGLRKNTLLIHLSLVGGGLTRFISTSLPNLNSLDLRDNHIMCLCHVDFTVLKSLRILVLRGNPLRSAVVHWNTSSSVAPPLTELDLTNCRVYHLSLGHLSVFANLHTLNLSGSSTQRITGAVSQSLGEVRVLDLRGCPVTDFPPHVFGRLKKLQALYSSSYRLCCTELLPEGFNLHNCLAPSDSLSDCDRLLKDDMHVIFTAIASALAVVGNVAGCVARLIRSRTRDNSFRVVMLHLCVSDSVMGLYLTIVSVAGWTFRGHYLWQDITWRHSVACHLSAFLSVLSSQVSAGIVCLVTLDSVAAHCVCMSRARFQPRSAYLLCAVTWLTGVTVAMVTTLPVTSLGHMGSDHALCTPLLVLKPSQVGPVIGGVIIFNSVLHVIIGVGAASVLLPSFVQSDDYNPVLTTDTSAEVVKTLTNTYITLCKTLGWFIFSLPVIINSSNVTLPEEVLVNITVFVLPLNAALNPLLSVLAVVVTRRRQAQRARLMKILASKVAAKSS